MHPVLTTSHSRGGVIQNADEQLSKHISIHNTIFVMPYPYPPFVSGRDTIPPGQALTQGKRITSEP